MSTFTIDLLTGNPCLFTGNFKATGDTINYYNSTQALQLIDSLGGVDVNTIQLTAINWTTELFSGTSLNFSGGSCIYIRDNGIYSISYVLNAYSNDSVGKNIGTIIRKNGIENIAPMISTSIILNSQNDSGVNIMPEYLISLLNGDYIELIAFRIGNSGFLYTKENGSWIKIIKTI